MFWYQRSCKLERWLGNVCKLLTSTSTYMINVQLGYSCIRAAWLLTFILDYTLIIKENSSKCNFRVMILRNVATVMKISDHTPAFSATIHCLYIHVFITSDVTIARPFIFLSWSYSESTNTICFSSPSSSSFFFHFSHVYN